MNKVKVGIIGCGGIANQKHLPSLTACADKCELTAFCDIVEERAVKAAKKYGTKSAGIYANHKELLDKADVDIVHVLTPNVVHASITIAAFEAGKHVLCEKPMAHTSVDAGNMIEAWRRSGKKFTIGYQNRFRPEVQALYKSCKDNELGKIYYAKAHAIRRRAVPTWGVFPNKALQGGGPLIDIGTHALDITLWMMDNYEPVSVSGSVYHELGHLAHAVDGNMFGPWNPDSYEVEDSAMGFIKMKNGATIYLEASWAINMLESKEASTTLCGTKAGAEIRSGMSYGQDELIYNRGKNGMLMEESLTQSGGVAYFEGGIPNPGVLEANQWLNAIIYDLEPLVKPEQAYKVTQILEAIYLASETGNEVKLS